MIVAKARGCKIARNAALRGMARRARRRERHQRFKRVRDVRCRNAIVAAAPLRDDGQQLSVHQTLQMRTCRRGTYVCKMRKLTSSPGAAIHQGFKHRRARRIADQAADLVQARYVFHAQPLRSTGVTSRDASVCVERSVPRCVPLRPGRVQARAQPRRSRRRPSLRLRGAPCAFSMPRPVEWHRRK